VDVVPDHAVFRHASCPLGGLGEALLAENLDRLLDIAARLVERRLAIHHSRAGLVAEFLHLCCCRCHFTTPESVCTRIAPANLR
jgi:hypothetical protein